MVISELSELPKSSVKDSISRDSLNSSRITSKIVSCSTLKRVNKKQLNPPLQPISSEQLFPGDVMQIDLVDPFQSPIYKYALSGIDVFSKYLFAVPLTSAHAGNVAKALVSLFLQHSYIPTTFLSDLGTSFVAKLQHEFTDLLEIQSQHASLKHPQTIGVVERSHSALTRILKLNTDESWSTWYRYVDLATFIHNTSHHSSIGCTPSSLFHGRAHYFMALMAYQTNRSEISKPCTSEKNS